jgi:hypothetical protein
VYTNDPRRYCQFAAFQWFFASIRVLEGVSLDLNPQFNTDECTRRWSPPKDIDGENKGGKGRSRDAKGKKDDGQQVSESVKDGKVSVDIGVNLKVSERGEKDRDDDEKSKNSFIGLNIPRGLGRVVANPAEFAALDRLRIEHLCLLREARTPVRFTWRSPERMVRYLGDILAVHTLGAGDKDGRPVQILNDDGHLVHLFHVRRGRELLGSTAVSVDGPDGERFWIPPTEPDSKSSHLSLQALALVMESFNLAVSGKALPQPATFFLSGG